MVTMALIDYAGHAREIEKLYIHTATVYEVKDEQPVTGELSPHISHRKEATTPKDTPKYKDIPCYIEFEDVGTREAVGNTIPVVQRKITLICSESYDIPEGSVIDGTRFGHTQRFQSAGLSDHLGSHQEIQMVAYNYALGV